MVHQHVTLDPQPYRPETQTLNPKAFQRQLAVGLLSVRSRV